MDFHFNVIWKSIPYLLQGAIATVRFSAIALLLSLLLGVVLGLAGASRVKALRFTQQAYAYIIRGIPLLVLLFIVYFGLPVIGLNVPAFVAGLLAYGLASGAYISEVVRSGIESIEKAQWEAGSLDGANSVQIIMCILLPQILRRITAGTTNELISLLKGSSLLGVIGIFELTRSAQIIASVQLAPFEAYLSSGIIYLLVVTVVVSITNFFERKVFY
jgi:polar amino acid transport system permease protein